MPTTVKIRRSGTASATPSALEHGEIAINYADGKVFWKNASDVITSFTFQSYALASHTHAASDITSGTLDAARLPLATTGAAGAVIVGTGLGVSSGTVSVTYGTSSTSACRGDDSRLSDTRTPTDGSVTTAKLANDAVTYAKIQNVSATDRLLGRSSAGAGDVEEITCTSFGRSLISSADAPAARTTLSVQPTASPTFPGTLTAATCSFSGTVTVTSPLVITGTVAGNVRQLRMQTSGSTRWEVGPGFDAESGSNVGSTFWVTRWSDSGVFLGTPIAIARATGVVTLENQLLVSAGSKSTCSVAPSGDPDTGMFFPLANTLALSTGDVERVRVDSSGNVGIGASPGTTLDIQRASSDAAVFVQGQTSGTGATLQMYSGSGLGYVGTRNNYPLLITSNNSERMRVKTTGSVRFVPLSADPSTGNEAGDVYYNSTTNKLRVYNGTSWVDLH